MSEDLYGLFDELAGAPRRLKRTYSRAHQCLAAEDDIGLATPPCSSSPPSSPTSQRTRSSPSSAMPRSKTQRPRNTARSITALLERSSNMQTSRRKFRRTTLPKDKKELVQMHLNLLPAHITCKECGMSYTRTSSSDATLHSTFHSSHLQGLPLSSTLAFSDGVHKLTYSKTSERNMLVKCLELVDLELSASLVPLDSGFSGFILVAAGRIQSFILVQPIKSARILDLVSGEEGVELPAVMGVSRMWTARRSRGQGKVLLLLDRARRDFVHGCVLSKTEVAFTQLSESGLKTVCKWRDDVPVLVYRD